MPTPTGNKAIKSIGKFVSPIQRTIDNGSDIEEGIKLPEAFPVVTKYLPLVLKVFSSITSYLEARTTNQETEEEREQNTEIKDIVEDLLPLATRLEDLFDTTLPDDSEVWVDRYKKAVGDGTKLEEVMRKLLEGVRDFAKEPLIGSDEAKELDDAIKEVKRLPASLDEPQGQRFVNSGDGIMPVYFGSGDQNVNAGSGFQVTGKGAHNTVNYNNGAQPAA